MVTRILLVFGLALAQAGCNVVEGGSMYEPVPVSPEGYEQTRRELLKLEDLKVGTGPIAAWGRKIEADIHVRYADGTFIYKGPAYTYAGMRGAVMIHNSVTESGAIAYPEQFGLILGLNGMAVGGKRRIAIPSKLICEPRADEKINPKVTCSLIIGRAVVRKEKLIVEATLTASCTPAFIRIPFFRSIEFCRNSEAPRRDPNDPIWRFYYSEPARH